MSQSEDPVKVQRTQQAYFKEQTLLTGVHYGYEESKATIHLPKLFGKRAFQITHLQLFPQTTGDGPNSYNDLMCGNGKNSMTSDGKAIVLQTRHGAKTVHSSVIAGAIDQAVIAVFEDEELTKEEAKKLRSAQKLLAKSIKRGDVEVETQNILSAFREAAAVSKNTRS